MTSQLSEPAQLLAEAVLALRDAGFSVSKVSRFFTTPCFPAGAGPDYVNAAVELRSSLAAKPALQLLHQIEHRFGRERKERWGARTLDLDLLAMGALVHPSAQVFAHWYQMDPALQAKSVPDEMIIPHPRIQDRGFVLVPLADIAPDWKHPVLNKTVREMLADLPHSDVSDIRPV